MEQHSQACAAPSRIGGRTRLVVLNAVLFWVVYLTVGMGSLLLGALARPLTEYPAALLTGLPLALSAAVHNVAATLFSVGLALQPVMLAVILGAARLARMARVRLSPLAPTLAMVAVAVTLWHVSSRWSGHEFTTLDVEKPRLWARASFQMLALTALFSAPTAAVLFWSLQGRVRSVSSEQGCVS